MFLGTKNKVYILDKTENNPTTIDGKYGSHPAWAVEYDINTNKGESRETRPGARAGFGMVARLGGRRWRRDSRRAAPPVFFFIFTLEGHVCTDSPSPVRPMDVYSNTFCAGGAVLGNGTWAVFGGNQRELRSCTACCHPAMHAAEENYPSSDAGTNARSILIVRLSLTR